MCVIISHDAVEFSWQCIFSDVLCFNNYSFVFLPQLPSYALSTLSILVQSFLFSLGLFGEYKLCKAVYIPNLSFPLIQHVSLFGILVKADCHGLLGLGMCCSRLFQLSKFSSRKNQCYSISFPSCAACVFFSCSSHYTFFSKHTQCFICDIPWDFLFWSCLYGVLCVSCMCMWVFLYFGDVFSMILVKIWSMPLTWNSSP